MDFPLNGKFSTKIRFEIDRELFYSSFGMLQTLCKSMFWSKKQSLNDYLLEIDLFRKENVPFIAWIEALNKQNRCWWRMLETKCVFEHFDIGDGFGHQHPLPST